MKKVFRGEKINERVKTWLLLIIGIAFSVYVALLPMESMLYWFDIDDGYFYFKVARNFDQGLGFTFDGINRTNGFHPLWMAVCVIVFRIFPVDQIMPLRMLIIAAGIFNGFSAILIFRILSRALNNWVSYFIACLWATWPAIYKVTTTQGMETGLSILLLLWLIDRAQVWFFNKEKIRVTRALLFGLFALLAVLARLDNVFYIGLICLFAVFRVRLTSKLLALDLVGLSLSVVLSYLITYNFGQINFSNHTIFPLLFLSLLIKPFFMYLFKVYRQKTEKTIARWIKMFAGIVAANILLVPILYFINSFETVVRFPKLIILLELAFSTGWISLNHFLQSNPSRGARAINTPVIVINKQTLTTALYVILPVAVGVGAYLIFNLGYFSTFLPVSGRIKHFWSTLDNTVYGRARDFFDVFGISERVNPWYRETSVIRNFTDSFLVKTGFFTDYNSRMVFSISLVFLVILLIAAVALARGRTLEKMGHVFLPALFIGSLFRIGFYEVYGYIGVRNWYWIVERLILFILISVLLNIVVDKLDKMPIGRVVYRTGLSILLIFSFVKSMQFISSNYPLEQKDTGRNGIFDGVETLEEFTPEGSLIGMTGGGLEGYFIHGRTIVNMDGLINSEKYYRSLTSGKAAEFFDALGLDYVYGNIYMLEVSDPYAAIFDGRLDMIHLKNEETALYQYVTNH